MSESSYTVLTFPASQLPDNYRPMVFNKFLLSLRYSNDYFKLIEKNAYFKTYERFIGNLLHRDSAYLRLAVLSDDHDVVLGWALMEPECMHYVYVNRDYRRIGIAKALVKEPFKEFSHLTKIAMLLWSSKFPEAKFNPFK
jgi:GNAT superfamily N-acetyltransferase